MTLTFDSLFAGIGGFDLALERAGMVCRRQVEIDKKCQQVLAHHWPNVERVSDVKKTTGLPTVELVCGGYPCQDHSVAGKRAGLVGERSGLWWEFHRLIAESRPRWVVIENVPGLRSSFSPVERPPFEIQTKDFNTKEEAERWARSFSGEWEVDETSDLETVLTSLAQLGYGWAYRSLDAQYDGLAQRRKRIFIVGYSGDPPGLARETPRTDIGRLSRIPAQVLFESESVQWDSAPSREAGERVAGTIAPGARPGGFNGQDAGRGNIVYQCQGSDVGPMGTLRKGNGGVTGGIPFIAQPLSAHPGRNSGEDNFIPFAFDTTQITSSDNHSNPKPGDPCHTLNSNAHPPALAFNWQSGGDVRLNISDEHTSALQKSQVPAVQERHGVRRFTPLECERLQGFPDGWSDVNGMSDSARYKMLGNAVAVPVVEWIARRIVECSAA